MVLEQTMSGTAAHPARTPLLDVQQLTVRIGDGPTAPMPLQGVDLSVPRGTRFGLVGESGSGKSLTAAAILGMLPRRATVLEGSIRLGGVEIVGCPERRLRDLRGDRMSIMFQNPRASLNPVLTVGWQIAEVIRVHERVSRHESRDRAIDLLGQMGIPDPARRARDYVHQYSGGMAQRAALAMALSCQPDLLIADEPTSGLDATLQQQVLELVVEQVSARGASLLFITHDISVVEKFCSEIAVMYAGRVLESGPSSEVLSSPANPYSAELLSAFRAVEGRRMSSISGSVPSLHGPLTGCAFAPRCPAATDECELGVPELRSVGSRRVACIKA